MEVTVEEVNSATRRIKFMLAASKVGAEFDRRVRELSKSVSVAGFRKGKVPRKIVEKRFGEDIRNESILELASEQVKSALSNNESQVVGRPVLENYSIDEETKDYEVSIQYEIFPEFTVKDIADCHTIWPVVTVTEEDIDREIEDWKDRYKLWEPVERPAQLNDRLLVDLEVVEQLTKNNKSYKNAHIQLGAEGLADVVNEECLGKSAGDRVTAVHIRKPVSKTANSEGGELSTDEIQLPEQKITYYIAIHSVEESVPDRLAPEFLDTLKVESIKDDNIRDKARSAVEERIEQMLKELKDQQTTRLLLHRNQFEPPQSLVLDGVFQQLVSGGLSEEQAREIMSNDMSAPEVQSKILLALVNVQLRIIVGKLRKERELEIDERGVHEFAENYLKQNSVGDQNQYNSMYNYLIEYSTSMREQELYDGLVHDLFNETQCEEVAMSYQEFARWRKDFDILEHDLKTSGEADDLEKESESSRILDASGNPIDKSA